MEDAEGLKKYYFFLAFLQVLRFLKKISFSLHFYTVLKFCFSKIRIFVKMPRKRLTPALPFKASGKVQTKQPIFDRIIQKQR